MKTAKKSLEDGGPLTILFLKALIKSKGSDPPGGRRKAPFEAAWNEVEHKTDWSRTEYFDDQDKKALELLEGDNSDEE